jgi:hypothetical protein
MNQIFLPEYPFSYKLLLVNFFALEQQQQLQNETQIQNIDEIKMEFNEEVHDLILIPFKIVFKIFLLN